MSSRVSSGYRPGHWRICQTRRRHRGALALMLCLGVSLAFLLLYAARGNLLAWIALGSSLAFTILLAVYVRDVAERKRVEKDLRDQRDKLELVTESIDAGLTLISPDYRVLWANRVLRRTFGDVAGRRCYEAFHGRAAVCAECGLHEIFKAGKERAVYERSAVGAEGRTIWVEISATPIRDAAGKVTAALELAMPITERKLAQQRAVDSEMRYQRLFEAAKDGILILEADSGRVADANPSMAQMLGCGREALLGKRFWEIGLFEDATAKAVFTDMQDRCYVRREDMLLNACDGRQIDAEFVSNTYLTKHLRVIQCNIRDITERRRAEREIQAMEVYMRQQQKLESIGTLASGVAHEINNPINGVMNYAQLIAEGLPPDSPLREYAGGILQETDRVSVIVHNLLAFARNEQQSHSPARIKDIVDATLALIRTAMRHDNIIMEVDVPADLPPVHCRSQQIEQVIMNLVTNARDALNERYAGAATDKVLRITAKEFNRNGREWIRTTVEDTGVGIPPEIFGRLFDPFFTTKPRDKGTGLGLSISHGIVKEHHGEITVESEPGKGTRVHIDLPASGERASSSPTAAVERGRP